MFINKNRFNEILETLTSNWIRTILTAFGVFWGIFVLIIVLSAANGFKNGVMRGFGNIATNSMFCWTRSTSMPYAGLPQNRRFRYNTDDVIALKSIKDLKYVVPRSNSEGSVSKELNTQTLSVFGDYPEYIKQEPLSIEEGRFINYTDINNRRKICIIGTGVVSELYKNQKQEVIGSQLLINGISFLVVGIYNKESSTDIEEQKNVFIPFSTFSQMYNMGNTIGWLALTAQDEVPITSIKPRIISLLKKRHKVNPEDERAIGNFDLHEKFKQIQGLFSILGFSGYFVGFLMLISGVIGVSNIMLIVVKERTKEIGIKRALGASPWHIRSLIIFESIFLTIISGIVGIVFATGIIYVVNKLLDGISSDDNTMFANPSVGIGTIISAFIILIISGTLAGLLPAQVAIRIRPIEALRDE